MFPTSTQELLKWRVAIRRADPKTKRLWAPDLSRDRVCSDHFLPSDYEPSCKLKILKKGAVPSVFEHGKDVVESSRDIRRKRREDHMAAQDIPSTSASVDPSTCEDTEKKFEDAVAQCELFPSKVYLSFADVKHDKKNTALLHWISGPGTFQSV